MEPRKPNFNSEFYEDAGDPLAEFRKKYRGGPVYAKKGKDPFGNDPDVIQAKRQKKLMQDEKNLGIRYY